MAGGERRLTPWTRLAFLVAGLAALAVLGAYPGLWLAPVQVVATFDELVPGTQVEARLGPQSEHNVRLRSWPVPVDHRLTIIATGARNPQSQGCEVAIGPSISVDDAAAGAEGFSADPGWTHGEYGGRWVGRPAPGQPSTLRWQGRVARKLVLPLRAFPAGGIVSFQWDDEAPRYVDLYSPAERWVEESLETVSSRAKLVGRLPYSFDALALQVRAGGGVLQRVQVCWGERTLYDASPGERLGVEQFPLRGARVTPAQLGQYVLENGSTVALRAVLYLIVSVLLGLPLAALLADRLTLIETYTLSAVAGAAIPTVLSAALTRWGCTGRSAFVIAMAVPGAFTVVWLLVAGARRGALARALVPERSATLELFRLLAVGLVASLVMFYPVLSWPTWFLGHSYTDTDFYFSTAETFRNQSFRSLLNADWQEVLPTKQLAGSFAQTRFAERNGDVHALLNTALLYNDHARRVFAQFHLNHWLILPFVYRGLLRRALKPDVCNSASPRPASRAALWLPAFPLLVSANLYALFTQCYLAHYVSGVLLLHVLFVAALYMDESGPGVLPIRGQLGLASALALILAASAASYPAQFLAPAVVAVVLLTAAVRRRSFTPVLALGLIGLGTLAFWNIGVATILGAQDVIPPVLDRLNDIGRYVVFTFHDSPVTFSAVVLGLRDWVGLSAFSSAIRGEVLPAGGSVYAALDKLLAGIRPLVLVTTLVVAVMTLLRMRFRNGTQTVIVSAVLVYAAVAAGLLATGQLYLGCKLLITLGIPVLVCVAVGIGACLRSTRWSVRATGAGLGIALTILNLRSAWYDNSAWLMSLYHPVLFAARTHVGAITEELREVADALPEPAPGSRPVAAVVGWYDLGRGTDRDRIVLAHLCYAARRYRIRHLTQPAGWTGEPPTLALVFDGYSLPPALRATARLRLASTIVSVWDFDSQTPRTDPSPAQ